MFIPYECLVKVKKLCKGIDTEGKNQFYSNR